jgi:hypothetical protein
MKNISQEVRSHDSIIIDKESEGIYTKLLVKKVPRKTSQEVNDFKLKFDLALPEY